MYDNDWHQQQRAPLLLPTFLVPASLMFLYSSEKVESGRDEEGKWREKERHRVKTISTIKITVGGLDNPRVNLEGFVMEDSILDESLFIFMPAFSPCFFRFDDSIFKAFNIPSI